MDLIGEPCWQNSVHFCEVERRRTEERPWNQCTSDADVGVVEYLHVRKTCVKGIKRRARPNMLKYPGIRMRNSRGRQGVLCQLGETISGKIVTTYAEEGEFRSTFVH